MVTSLLTLYAVAKSLEPRLLADPGAGARDGPGAVRPRPTRPAPQSRSRHRDHVHVGRSHRSAPATWTRPAASSTRTTAPTRTSTSSPTQDAAPDPAAAHDGRRHRRAWSALSLALTVVAGPLFGYTGRAAQDIARPRPYISSVLPGGLAMSRHRHGPTARDDRRGYRGLQLAGRGLADRGLGGAVGRPVGRQRPRRAPGRASWSAWCSRSRRCAAPAGPAAAAGLARRCGSSPTSSSPAPRSPGRRCSCIVSRATR